MPDALAFALVSPAADDPIEGILHGVQIELEALADALEEHRLAAMLGLLARRLDVARRLLRYTDNRLPMPSEPEEPEEPENLQGVDDEQAP